MILIADTSGLVAAFNSAEPEHASARRALTAAGLAVISPLVLLEVEAVAGRRVGRDAARGIVDWVLMQTTRDRIRIPAVSASSVRAARSVQRRYADLDLDLTDAVNVVLADEFETNRVLTLDRRDFRAVAPLRGFPAFLLSPDDDR